MDGRKKRPGRRKNPHPGVILRAPSGEHVVWRGQWRDADNGRQTSMRLDPLEYPTAEKRTEWAIAKAKQLVRRKLDIDAGADVFHGTELERAVEQYYENAQLRDSTRALYKLATDEFLRWARARGVRSTKDLRPARLASFRDYLLAQRKHGYERAEKGRKASRKAGGEKLSAASINWKLRAIKTVLNYLRTHGLVPLTSDAIALGLKAVKGTKDPITFLRQHECQKLLEAALRHDQATARTRAGTIEPRYSPIAPFVATVLLGGFRVGEALALRWDQVDLSTVDADGALMGMITLKGDGTKTGHGRVVSLEVSPTLRRMLAAMKLRAGESTHVFGGKAPLAKSAVEAARRRLVGEVPQKPRKQDAKRVRKAEVVADYGAPKGFSWQMARSTCATFQCNAPAIFGAAAAHKSAKRLGHSITVSERFYADELSVSRTATTLEEAMGIDALMELVIAGVGGEAVDATNVVRLVVG